jgi:sigma-B regulation protein RsbU (phosphoserine phosphatase)
MDLSKPTQTIFYEAIINGPDKRQDKQKVESSVRSYVDNDLQRFTKWGDDSEFLHRDLEIAKKVQKASFPQEPPAISGLQFASFYQPAHGVGGDYYDFLPLEDGALGVAIGDVSGKGIGAALLMASLQASLRTQALRPRSKIETLMKNINRLLRESSPAEFFASLFYGEYQPASHLLIYVNAGHNPPMVVRRSHDHYNLFTLHSGGAPVGALESSCYRSASFQLEPGDLLVAYTDGITESENPEGEPFGQHRLEQLLCSCDIQDPQHLLRTILDQLSAHSRRGAQADDMTLVVMRVES